MIIYYSASKNLRPLLNLLYHTLVPLNGTAWIGGALYPLTMYTTDIAESAGLVKIGTLFLLAMLAR